MPLARNLMMVSPTAPIVTPPQSGTNFIYNASSAWGGGFNNCAAVAAVQNGTTAQSDTTAVITGGDIFGWHVSNTSLGAGMGAGTLWQPANGGLTSEIHGLGIAYSPFVDQRIYMQFGIGKDPSSVSGGLCISTDGGQSWNDVISGAGDTFGNLTGEHPRAVGNTLGVVKVATKTILRVGSADGIWAMVDPGGSNPSITVPASPQALAKGICASIAEDPQDATVTYVAVRENWGDYTSGAGGPTAGLYKVQWNSSDGHSSATATRITNSTASGKVQPARVDRVIAVVEDGVTVIYAGTPLGILRYPTNRVTTGGCDDWNGSSGANPFPTGHTIGGLCAKQMPTGKAVVYAGVSPLGSDTNLTNLGPTNNQKHVYRTIDGGTNWHSVDAGFTDTVFGDPSGDDLYCFSGTAQFLPSGSSFDIGTFAYIPNANGTNKDRMLCVGRTCIWGVDIDCTATTGTTTGTLGTFKIYSKGINGSEAHSVGKDPVRGTLYGGDVDWDILYWPNRGASYPDYGFDRMPIRSTLNSSHGTYDLHVDRDHGVAMFGGGQNTSNNGGTLGYTTIPPSDTNKTPWTLFPTGSAAGTPPGGDGRIVGVCGFFLPSNYANSPWTAANPKDFVMIYARASISSNGGMFVGVNRFPSVPSGNYTSVVTFDPTNMIVDWVAAGGTTGSFNTQGHSRIIAGSLGVDATGASDGTKGWIYAVEPGGNIWRSSNYGKTWATIPGAPAVANPATSPSTLAASYRDATAAVAQDSTNPDRLIYQSINGPVRIDDAKVTTPNIVNIYNGLDDAGASMTTQWGEAGPVACHNFSGGSKADEVFIIRNAHSGTGAGAWYSTNAFTATATNVVWRRQNDPTILACIVAANDMQLTADGNGNPRALMSNFAGGYRVARITG